MALEMAFEFSDRAKRLHEQALAFAREHVAPAEAVFTAQVAEGERFKVVPIMEELKKKARAQGLWNLFLPESERGGGLDQPRVRADRGDHRLLPAALGGDQLLRARHRQHGSARALRHARAQEEAGWSRLLAGEIRSAFCMTEPDVASSDATNIQARIESDGDDYVINGRKWWSSGAGDPRCKVFIFMGKTDPSGRRTTAAVDDRRARATRRASRSSACSACSATITRRTATPRSSSRTCASPGRIILLGEGRGFEIAQGRLGPGRIHHCMRSIGVAERALELMCKRVAEARGLRQEARRHGHDPPGHRAVAHRDRPGAPARHARRVHDGHASATSRRRQEIAAIKVMAPSMALARDRPRHPGARRRWACARTRSSPPPGRTSAPCASRTDRTKCTSIRSRASS